MAFVLFALSAALPWYYTIAHSDLVQERLAIDSWQFWYHAHWYSCENTCDTTFTVEFWEFAQEDASTRAVFGVTWVLTVSCVFTALTMCINGKASPSIVLAIQSALGILLFLLINPAIRADGSCSGGPCDSFIGQDEEAGVTVSWGPSAGWYFAILGWLDMLVISLWGTFCCCFRSCSKRQKYQRIKTMEEPTRYQALSQPVYTTPVAVGPAETGIILEKDEYQSPPAYGY